MTFTITAIVGIVGAVAGAFAKSAAKKLGSQLTFKPPHTNGTLGQQPSTNGNGTLGQQSVSFWEIKMHEAVKEGVREELAIAVVPLLQANQKSLDEIAASSSSMDKNLALLVALQQRK